MKKLSQISNWLNQKGLTTIVTLFIMIMLTMIGLAAIMISSDEINIASNEANEMAAFYAAEAGLERASAAIQEQYIITGYPPVSLPTGSETVSGNLFVYDAVDQGAAVQRPLAQGTLAGLNAAVKTYTITSTGSTQKDKSSVSLAIEFEAALVPLFQFAVFYDNDLEIAPGPDMSLIGRVHTNGDLWLQAGSNLYMESFVTCGGDIQHGRKGPGGVTTGDIHIKDTDGNYQNMKNGDGTFLDSDESHWYDTASTRWGGRVQDAAFGQESLNLPLAGGDPHKLIERYDGGANPDSYEAKAEAKIINGAYLIFSGGVWTDVTALLPAGTITSGTFYDDREEDDVNATDVDMSLLQTSPYFPDNGIIYASDQSGGSFNALRLNNGSDIGKPLSIYSENPVYVKGDYNSVNKQPAAICGDAVTFLSNAWNDADSYTNDCQDRKAVFTECNAAIMTGNVETTNTDYNGGLENLPRFLEDWSPGPGGAQETFRYTGSMIDLWFSQQATGLWHYGDDAYEAPDRDWSYDIDFDDPSKLPPGTPMIQVFLRTGWRMEDIAYQTSYHDSLEP